MSRICFGQNFEDVILWRALGHLETGNYLDIGAQHPEIDSVSRSFYLAGWRGIHVEPVPYFANAMRADRPDEIVIQAAVGSSVDPIAFHVIEGTGLSTGLADVAALHAEAGHSTAQIEAQQITLNELLDRFSGKDLHWLKIDVEGMEPSVLASWGQSSVRPWIVVIEAIDPVTGEQSDHEWRDLIERRGYHEALFDGISRFFVADEHAELDAKVALPANCRDDFAVPWHHWIAANAVALFQNKVAAAEAAAQALQSENRQISASLVEKNVALEASNAAISRTEAELATLHELRERLEMQLVWQATRLRHAHEIANLAKRATSSWYAVTLAIFSKKGRALRLELRTALDAWLNSLSEQVPVGGMVQESEIAVMELFTLDRRDPYQRAASLEELCRFADRDFICCAFVTLLARQPDPDGEAYYLGRLRRGESMLSILSALRRSAEGRLHDPGIAGLDRALRKHRRANLPLIGWLIRIFTAEEGNSRVERQLRALGNMLSAERTLAEARAAGSNHMQMQIADKLDLVEKQLKTALVGQVTTPQQIAQVEAGADKAWGATLASVLSGK